MTTARPAELLEDARLDEELIKALCEARRAAARLHAAYGQPLLTWREGRVVAVDPVASDETGPGISRQPE